MRVAFSIVSLLLVLLPACADSGRGAEEPSYNDAQRPAGTGGAPGLASMEWMQSSASSTSIVAGTSVASTSTGMSEGFMAGSTSSTGGSTR